MLASATTTNWFRYIGRLGYYYDVDLAEYYLRARHYDPAAGRFLSRDPLRNPARPNPYSYVYNSPLTFVDPEGRQILAGGGGAVVVVGGGGAAAGVGAGVAGTVAVGVGVVGAAALACMGPFFSYAKNAGKGDKWAHCYVACKGTKWCGALITQTGGLGYEGPETGTQLE